MDAPCADFLPEGFATNRHGNTALVRTVLYEMQTRSTRDVRFADFPVRAVVLAFAAACARDERSPGTNQRTDSAAMAGVVDTTAAPRAWAVPPSAHNLACEPAVLRSGDTLTLRMEGRHGASLYALAPDGTMFLVVFHGEGDRDRARRRSLMPPDSFARLEALRIDPRTLHAGAWVFGRDTNELLFRQQGYYRLIVGTDLETDGPVYAECVVRYLP